MSRTVAELIGHPERLDKDSLYGLRELVARYPYYQAARLLFLKNLYILHDDSFGEELRKAAVFVADRRVLFEMVEGHNYEIHEEAERPHGAPVAEADGDRTQTLIDSFLRGVGEDEPEEAPRRKPTVADATTNYVAYLLDMDDLEPAAAPAAPVATTSRSTQLIDGFISHGADGIVLQETLEYTPELADEGQDGTIEEDYFTETLAKIYIKQGRYEKAMEIIRKLNLNYPKKNRYFADQMRFLQKLIINQKYNKQ